MRKLKFEVVFAAFSEKRGGGRVVTGRSWKRVRDVAEWRDISTTNWERGVVDVRGRGIVSVEAGDSWEEGIECKAPRGFVGQRFGDDGGMSAASIFVAVDLKAGRSKDARGISSVLAVGLTFETVDAVVSE